MSQYRADIDGLRAVAILPVVLFHAGFGFAPGGFVGVDVFFVVSGYLITTLIHGELAAGRFSLVHFYERRVRRLFPALFAMLAFSTVVAAWLLLPQDLRYFGGSLFATTLFASNVFFWLEAGYFDVAAERKPLLHTWSLAVEEQFYLLFPLFLLLLLRWLPRRLVVATLGVTLVSLLASELVLRHSGSAAFYLAPFRAWELGLGALLALGGRGARPRSWPAEIAAWLGLGLIFASVAWFSWQTPFPGLHALVPCAGAALVIWSGGGSSAGRLLSARPVVFVGLVSYSLYLWHWPLLVFARHLAVRELTGLERTAVLLASVAVAIASWRFIERPFRGSTGLLSRRTLFGVAAGTMAALCAMGLAATLQSGWPQRFDPVAHRFLAAGDDRNPRQAACSMLDASDLRAGRACRLGAADGPEPEFIVWGDSHADMLMPTFDRLARESGRSGLYLGRIGCPPLLEVERRDLPFGCRDFNDAARTLLEAFPAARVVLVARWSHFTREPTYGHEERTRVVITDPESTRAEVAANDAVLVRGLERTLSFLHGREVFVVATVPEIGLPVPQALAQLHRFGRDLGIGPTLEQYRARQRFVEHALREARQRHGFTLLEPAAPLCAAGRCRVAADGEALYADEDHLSSAGTALVAPVLVPVVR